MCALELGLAKECELQSNLEKGHHHLDHHHHHHHRDRHRDHDRGCDHDHHDLNYHHSEQCFHFSTFACYLAYMFSVLLFRSVYNLVMQCY